MATSDLKRLAEGREAEIFEWEPGTVLRLFRTARSAESLANERAAMDAVRAHMPLVPQVLGLAEVMGRPGIIMERIDGLDLLSRFEKKPWSVWSGGRMTGEVHARLHEVVAPETIPSLRESISRRAGSPLVPPRMAEWALAEVESLPDGDRVLHGDFHPGNILLSPHGPVVIDWPNVTRGNPDADLGRTLLMMRMGSLPPGTPAIIRVGQVFGRSLVRIAYLRAYRRARHVDMQAVARWSRLRAVDRLSENIPEERPALLAVVEKAMASA